MKVNLWKSGSSASRPKSGRPKSGHQSIRGKISAPIPIPNRMEDDEFPIRKPGTGIATTTEDDEFPMRSPGSRVASATPLDTEEMRLQLPNEPASMDTPADTSTGAPADAEVLVSNLEVPQDSTPEPATDSSRPESRPATPQVDPSVTEPEPAPAPEPPSDNPELQPTESPASEPPPEAPQLPEPSESAPSAVPAPVPQPLPPRTSPQGVSPHRTSLPRRTSPTRRASLTRRVSPSRRSSPPRTSPAIHRTNPNSTARYSTASAASTGLTGESNGPPQRKKSTLRSALGRLFGRKKKSPSQSSTGAGRISGMANPSQHRSDPTALNRAKKKEGEPKRSASLPITEFDRALRSHSVGPDDITTITEVRNSMQGDTAPSRKRAATTSSKLFLHPRGYSGQWGLSPRPASSHGRGSHQSAATPEDPNEIGRAITSDSVADRSRRRSRSLSGLQDVSTAGPGDVRRRSDEIRFWRESYDPGFLSPLSSNPQEDMDNDDTGVVDVSVPESPVAERPPKTPPQPFNFGAITHEMVGMKITQAASMETRISTLETRMHSLERIIDQLCRSIHHGFETPLRPPPDRVPPLPTSDPSTFAYTIAAPPMIPAIYQAISEDLKGGGASHYSASRHSGEDDSHSQVSFGDAHTFIGSLYPPSSSATQTQSLTTTAAPSRIPVPYSSTSTSTVRGATSMPSMGREPTTTSASMDTLSAQLEAERAARQALEAQVKKLSERLNVLSSTLFTMVRDPQKARSQERLTLTPAATTPAPAPTTPSPGAKTGLAPQRVAAKAMSVFETDDEDDDELENRDYQSAGRQQEKLDENAAGTEGMDEDEDFLTPREEHPRPQLYGAFGEELCEEDGDGKKKKAARTLSLSQLTLGKGVLPQI